MSITADGQEFKVRVSDEAIGEDLETRMILGLTTEDTNVIVIDGTLPRTRKEEVALHELIHVADPTMPEFLVRQLGVKLYGILSTNSILRPNWLERISDGLPTSEEMDRVQAVNDEIKEAQENGMLVMRSNDTSIESSITGDPVAVTSPRGTRVSMGPWFGNPIEGGSLQVHEDSGELNRVAVHKAATYLLAGAGTGSNRISLTREVIKLFKEQLGETPPPALSRLVRAL